MVSKSSQSFVTPVTVPEVSDSEPSTAGLRPAKLMRADIQALRAFAVIAVVLNHVWPKVLPGGFIGVDVFFVISGFLITSHLLKETLQTGKVRLVRFYSRRIRRLLPAAFTVIAVSFFFTWWFLPLHLQVLNFRELFSSAAYGENLYLTLKAVDYHAAGQSASLAQHYWSLSVEEQFYFLWPLLLMLVASFFTRRLFASTIFISVFTVGFFCFSLWFTHYSPHQAYFFTPVRFWEFGLGALVAALAVRYAGSFQTVSWRWLRLIVACFAWVGLFASTLWITPQQAFPGFVALLPTVSTLLVIACGTGVKLPVLEPVANFKPIRMIGDASYSIYLWHWPALLVAPYVLGHTLSLMNKVLLILGVLVVGYASKLLIEDRGLANQRFAASARLTFTAMLVALLVFAGLTATLEKNTRERMQMEEARFQAALQTDCVGPGTLAPGNQCENKLALPLTTSLTEEHNYYQAPADCRAEYQRLSNGQELPTLICDFRPHPDQPVQPADLVMLIGDSHADQWKWPLYQLAKQAKKRLEVKVVAGCPVHNYASFMTTPEATATLTDFCALSSLAIHADILAAKPHTVVYSNYGKHLPIAQKPGENLGRQELYNRALATTWQQWLDGGVQHVLVVADVPYNNEVRDPSCWYTMPDPATSCRVERSVALGQDPLPGAAKLVADPRLSFADFTDAYCDAEYCYAVVGQMPVYFDDTHVSRQYILRLTDRLASQLPFFDSVRGLKK